MGKLEKLVLWILVVLALAISVYNFVRISHNSNIIRIISETQSYIVEML